MYHGAVDDAFLFAEDDCTSMAGACKGSFSLMDCVRDKPGSDSGPSRVETWGEGLDATDSLPSRSTVSGASDFLDRRGTGVL